MTMRMSDGLDDFDDKKTMSMQSLAEEMGARNESSKITAAADC